MYSIRGHINSLLLIAGFILMAGGGAELAKSEQDPEPSGHFAPEGGLQYIVPTLLLPVPYFGSDPQGAGTIVAPEVTTIATGPEVAAAEAPEVMEPNYTADLEREATGNMLRFIEGPFGALIMVCSGIGAIVAGAFGAYKAAISLLFIAVGSFILRALVSLFFGGGFQATGVGEFVGGNGAL